MPRIEPLGYQENEACMALINGEWRDAVVMKRKGSTIYSLMFPDERVMESGEDKFRDVSLKKMARAQVLVCSRCGNWIDPNEVPSLGYLDGPKGPIIMQVSLHCPHGDMPYTMQRLSWNEVPGVSAIGGIHAIS
jgi:hypothetical protein